MELNIKDILFSVRDAATFPRKTACPFSTRFSNTSAFPEPSSYLEAYTTDIHAAFTRTPTIQRHCVGRDARLFRGGLVIAVGRTRAFVVVPRRRLRERATSVQRKHRLRHEVDGAAVLRPAESAGWGTPRRRRGTAARVAFLDAVRRRIFRNKTARRVKRRFYALKQYYFTHYCVKKNFSF